MQGKQTIQWQRALWRQTLQAPRWQQGPHLQNPQLQHLSQAEYVTTLLVHHRLTAAVPYKLCPDCCIAPLSTDLNPLMMFASLVSRTSSEMNFKARASSPVRPGEWSKADNRDRS